MMIMWCVFSLCGHAHFSKGPPPKNKKKNKKKTKRTTRLPGRPRSVSVSVLSTAAAIARWISGRMPSIDSTLLYCVLLVVGVRV